MKLCPFLCWALLFRKRKENIHFNQMFVPELKIFAKGTDAIPTSEFGLSEFSKSPGLYKQQRTVTLYEMGSSDSGVLSAVSSSTAKLVNQGCFQEERKNNKNNQ